MELVCDPHLLQNGVQNNCTLHVLHLIKVQKSTVHAPSPVPRPSHCSQAPPLASRLLPLFPDSSLASRLLPLFPDSSLALRLLHLFPDSSPCSKAPPLVSRLLPLLGSSPSFTLLGRSLGTQISLPRQLDYGHGQGSESMMWADICSQKHFHARSNYTLPVACSP